MRYFIKNTDKQLRSFYEKLSVSLNLVDGWSLSRGQLTKIELSKGFYYNLILINKKIRFELDTYYSNFIIRDVLYFSLD